MARTTKPGHPGPAPLPLWRLLAVSAAFSVLTALLLNLAAQRLIVGPIRRVIGHMTAYSASPEDSRTIITPSARMAEVRAAETAASNRFMPSSSSA